MPSYYQHSGKFLPQGIIAGLLVGGLFAVPSAFLYDYGIASIPYAKLRAICTVAFGAIIGVGCGLALCWGKVRNKTIAGLVGAGASLFGLYISWIAWLMHLWSPSRWVFDVTRPALHPERIWKVVLVVNSVGTWSYGHGGATKGTALWFVWLCEAALIFLCGAGVAVAFVEHRPFCERCTRWCSERLSILLEPTIPPQEFQRLVESGPLSDVEKMPAGKLGKPHYQIHLHCCGECRSLNTLTAVQQLPRNRRVIVKKMIAAPEQAAFVRDLVAARRATTGRAATVAMAK